MVSEAAGDLFVQIRDDGSPDPAPAKDGGFGLIGMRERVEACGGTLSAGRDGEAAGWSVIARLPQRLRLEARWVAEAQG